MKIFKIALGALLLPSFVFAQDDCSKLNSGVNFSIDSQVKIYCLSDKIDTVMMANNNAEIEIKDNRFSVITSDEGTLFNVLISLENGESIDATFVSLNSPKIKKIITVKNSDPDFKKFEEVTLE